MIFIYLISAYMSLPFKDAFQFFKHSINVLNTARIHGINIKENLE